MPVNNQEYFVLLSFFFDFKNGAIQYSRNDIKVLHSECNFNNNTRTDRGGSVYFECNSSFVQNKICSLSSQTTVTGSEGGHHSFSNSKDSSKLNFFYYSSICLCGNEKSVKTISLFNGNISVRSTNISQCTAYAVSGYGLHPLTDTTVSFCTIENTTCKPDHIVLGHYQYKPHFVSFCNILNNKQSTTEFGMIYCNIVITIENCSIFGNEGPSGFRLFSIDFGYSFTVKNSYVQSSPSIPNGITTENIKAEEKYLTLSHLSTSKCEALIPIVNNDDNKIIKEEDDTFNPEYVKFIQSLFVPLSSPNITST
ncbi:hypothetical protein TVAG_228720 [Trichomonas vaginalis G3]|uniref:Right handed beta helix domain-containing protein n=1 Tax=Trichomonas vaginalis (strain ATCC PRA-98 / G3) TaxID=412133 RepID=A2DJ34_TRIV3|nr:hypothetical protein TVAGG3_0470840 [Trichomonas vaginalis G3]EAY19609.1 hypothetical protein TVAG_228720 [Trichomonas vaginalis G3]KAI5515049.1 hypothetical protein TVAGG3_0470840 [Trichomonas vaginalis G3]|eukprot:XP_001580595.1 hypothetical protein [Trichomonas vaginalis G3]